MVSLLTYVGWDEGVPALVERGQCVGLVVDGGTQNVEVLLQVGYTSEYMFGTFCWGRGGRKEGEG
jgi:hypothetical protein